MPNTTLSVELDEATRARLNDVANRIDGTLEQIIQDAIRRHLQTLESGIEALGPTTSAQRTETGFSDQESDQPYPFLALARSILPQPILRAAITAAYRQPEEQAVPLLLELARLPDTIAKSSQALAYRLANQLRARKTASGRAGLVQGLLQEFSLSSQEGVALMCLAEALLRVPDKGTRDALIRDKISTGNWQQHLGNSPSMFVNAASWGLLVTGKLVSTHNETGMTHTLNRIIGKGGEPVIRKAVDMAMRMMGEQFVTGETISEALANASRLESRGFRYSYDMLGEAAMTAEDASAYLSSYEQAIHSIGKASNGRGIYEGPGISIKLSALHPRYTRAQYDRVVQELYPRLLQLARLAREYDIGINIDAEESYRLDLSLDLLERLCFDPELQHWNGIGFVIQAYQKRCTHVVDHLIDLARRSSHRLMIRLVKGAYWDSEIKFAQLEGLEGYPVFTRKMYTDISYIACARKLLQAPDAVYPQFATHNAHSLATIYYLAGENYYAGQYEFQCLHGMGEPLYDEVVGRAADGKLNRPCRIYAPVGTHETLLAYLVRRLLENGANTSFVNRIADRSISIRELVEDPIATVQQAADREGAMGLPHPRIPLPRDLYGQARVNSSGIDLSNEHRLASLSSALLASNREQWRAQPVLGCPIGEGQWEEVRNPADLRDCVGLVRNATKHEASDALQAAQTAAPIWQATPPSERAAILERAADAMESGIESLLGLLAREAGKTFSNGIAEVREAVDFLRFYARLAREDFDNDLHRPLGTVLCISPWNFPLAIFTGQLAAALAAGNAVIAKPAEQTPLVAAQAISFLIQAGVPQGAVQLLPGDGAALGEVLVGDERTNGVMFTGSTEVAGIIARNLAGRLNASGRPIPLIAETGGQNAMIVDSSALTEQVVADVVNSAFDSAGQRCSALRVLCVQEDVAERLLTMLKGHFAEFNVGNPDTLATDVGPVIDAEAKSILERHIQEMQKKGRRVFQAGRHHPGAIERGTFVLPTLIEIEDFQDLQREVFGPVLHVLRYRREQLSELLDKINGTGYGLTLGVHTRIDETIDLVISKAHVGNLYVNRNIVGAVVGVQPFGGERLSGTGPKAGGPLYMYRLLSNCPPEGASPTFERMDHEGTSDLHLRKRLTARIDAPLNALRIWASEEDNADLLAACDTFERLSQSGVSRVLPGPTGERNTYTLLPRERVLSLADDQQDRLIQLAALLAVGCLAVWPQDQASQTLLARLPQAVQRCIDATANWPAEDTEFEAVLHHGDADKLRQICQVLAQRSGPIVGVEAYAQGDREILLERLYIERSVSTNTAAAGGNASLMSIS